MKVRKKHRSKAEAARAARAADDAAASSRAAAETMQAACDGVSSVADRVAKVEAAFECAQAETKKQASEVRNALDDGFKEMLRRLCDYESALDNQVSSSTLDQGRLVSIEKHLATLASGTGPDRKAPEDDRLAAMEQQLAGLATAPGLRSPGVSRTLVWMGGSFLAGFAVAVGIMVEVSSAWNCSWTCRAAVA